MAEISNYKVASSPHKVGRQTVRGIMLDVIIALIPCVICGIIFYGLYSLMLLAICVATCLVSEQIYNKTRKKPFTTDLSAVVTGIILGLNLPPRAAWYLPVIGGVFAIVVVKMLFGGIGKNFANPAATARVFLLLAYGSMGTRFIAADLGNMFLWDVTSSATYLGGGALADSFMGVNGYWGNVLQLFFGYTGGSIGETCVLAILAGGVYLCIRRVIDWRIPVVYIATSALMVLICYQSAREILLQLFAGGLMFGAVFMATDYATSPKWIYNRILYAVGLGVLTVLIRRFAVYPEGVSLAILVMNLTVPLMDRYLLPVRLGQTNRKGVPAAPVIKYAMWILCAAGALALAVAVPTAAVIQANSYSALDFVGNYDYIRSVQALPGEKYFRFNVSDAEQQLEYNLIFEGKDFTLSKIRTVKGAAEDASVYEGKGYSQIVEMDETDQLRDMILECYTALSENDYNAQTVAAGLEYRYVRRLAKSGFSGDYIVNVTGTANIPFEGGVYPQALEYNVHIGADDFTVNAITPVKQSTMDEKYTLKRELFTGKTLQGILAIDSDLFSGATYTHGEFLLMLEEAFRALNDAGVGTSPLTLADGYQYAKSAEASQFFGGVIVNVQGKAVLLDQGNYEQALEYNVCINEGKVTYIGAIRQSTWGFPAKTDLFIGKTANEVENLAADELTGATYTNTELKKMILEAFAAAKTAGGERA